MRGEEIDLGGFGVKAKVNEKSGEKENIYGGICRLKRGLGQGLRMDAPISVMLLLILVQRNVC